ncbi:hypothetical protein MHYP_G00322270 [Metynnis hypsauchen]
MASADTLAPAVPVPPLFAGPENEVDSHEGTGGGKLASQLLIPLTKNCGKALSSSAVWLERAMEGRQEKK